jgi:hypothetical protein
LLDFLIADFVRSEEEDIGVSETTHTYLCTAQNGSEIFSDVPPNISFATDRPLDGDDAMWRMRKSKPAAMMDDTSMPTGKTQVSLEPASARLKQHQAALVAAEDEDDATSTTQRSRHAAMMDAMSTPTGKTRV